MNKDKLLHLLSTIRTIMESAPAPSLSTMSGSSTFTVSGVAGIGGDQDIKLGKNATRGANSWGANNTKASAEYHKNNNMSLSTNRGPSYDDRWRNNIVTADDQSDPITQRNEWSDGVYEGWERYLSDNWHGEDFEPGYGWNDPILQWVDKNGTHHYIPNPTFNHPSIPLGYPHVQNPGDNSPHSPYTPTNAPAAPAAPVQRYPYDPNAIDRIDAWEDWIEHWDPTDEILQLLNYPTGNPPGWNPKP